MKIKIIKDGPYEVDGEVPLNREEIQDDKDGTSCCWKDNGKVKTNGDYHLCRCGNSKNKPFCDGSHKTTGFEATDAREDEKYAEDAQAYEGEKLILCDKTALCASGRFCDRAGSAWNLVEQSDEESEQILRQEVCDCPSGRLTLKDKATGETVEKKLEPSISIVEDKPADVSGPLWVKGKIEIESSNGLPYEKRNRVTLCRCGKSRNKPFCDSSHVSEGFKE
jgi:CDGSH-type Zn-finger protein